MKYITTIEIPALKGKRVIADSKLFYYIDSDFRNYRADKPGIATKKMKLDVFELDKDATFAQMMAADNLLTQEQILYFIERHKELLRQDGYATFFPFKSGEEVFVAGVYVDDGGCLGVVVRRFSDDGAWNAGYRPRFVLPQLILTNSEPSPSDTLTLDSAIKKVKEAGYQVSKIL